MPPARSYSAITVDWPTVPAADAVELLAAALDEAQPTALEETPFGCRVFFASTAARDRALELARAEASSATCTAVEISDEAWAERSQAGLAPVTIRRLTVAPPWSLRPATVPADHWITIEPSMGFGTGHHQSTRLCLTLLQAIAAPLGRVVDIGTGSGVLAIAAARLGATSVEAIDYDADAIACARENVARNHVEAVVALDARSLGTAVGEWDTPTLEPGDTDTADTAGAAGGDHAVTCDGRRPVAEGGADLVMGNLTGATLLKLAPDLTAMLGPAGRLIVSGFQGAEVNRVAAAFSAQGLRVAQEIREDEWVALLLERANPFR